MILRNFLSYNVVGLFELTVDGLIIFPFLAGPYVFRKKGHIAVDILLTTLSERANNLLKICVLFLSLPFPILLFWKGSKWALQTFDQKVMTLSTLPYPKYIIISVIAFGALFLVIEIVREIIANYFSLLNHSSENNNEEITIKDKPWFYPLSFIAAVVISMLIFFKLNMVVGIFLFAVVILFAGMPVFLALGLTGCLGIYFISGSRALMQIPITAYTSLESFPLTALPLFIIGGLILEESGLIDDMFSIFNYLFRGFSAGIPLAVIALGAVFCAITGSSVGATAVVAAVVLPYMVKRGYNKALSSGIIAGATVGTLIPPSIGAIIYGVITGDSIAQLFMVGIIPAVVLFGLYALYVIAISIFSKESLWEKGQTPQTERENLTGRDILPKLITAFWGFIIPIIILGGIYLGIFTPTEAAGVLVIYSVFISLLIKKRGFKNILKGIINSSKTSTMILCIIFSAYIFGLVVSQLRISPQLVSFVEANQLGPTVVLIIICLFLTFLGFFLDASSILVITLPIFYPMAMAVGIHPLILAIFYRIVQEMGLLTPPVGMNLFAIHAVTGIPIGTVIKGSYPFLLMMLITLLIIYFFPSVAIWLPSTMKGI